LDNSCSKPYLIYKTPIRAKIPC